MKKSVQSIIQLFAFLSIVLLSANAETVPDLNKKTDKLLINSHLQWIENLGQFDNDISFIRKNANSEILLMADGEIRYSGTTELGNLQFSEFVLTDKTISSPEGIGKSATRLNYLKKEPMTHVRKVSSYSAVGYEQVWEGVDLHLHSGIDQMEKFFILSNGSLSGNIKMGLKGTDEICIDEQGELQVDLHGGQSIFFSSPVAWQEIDHSKSPVPVQYKILDPSGIYGFELENYLPGHEVIIDPVLNASFIGGNRWDFAQVLKIGRSGKVYVAGVTESAGLTTTPNAFDPVYNDTTDIFVARYNDSLTKLEICTFIGGSGVDILTDIALDTLDNIYFTGQTQSEDYPTTANAYDNSYNNPGDEWMFDMMVSSLDNNLETLRSSTYFGTLSSDYGTALDIDRKQDVIITGHTWGKIPEVGPQFNDPATGCIFIKFDPGLSNLLATNSISGNNFFFSSDLVVDSSDNVFIAGDTWATNMPTDPNAHSVINEGKRDGYIFRVDNRLTNFLSGTYIGGTEDEFLHTIITDRMNNVYVGGNSKSDDFPFLQDAYDTLNLSTFPPGQDGLICVFDSNLFMLEAATFLGGYGIDNVYDLALDSLGNILATGYTTWDFPVYCNSYDPLHNGAEDGFISKLDVNLKQLLASTYIGGHMDDHSYSIELNEGDTVYIAGFTTSPDFPVLNAADTLFDGGPSDGFVLSIDPELNSPYPCCAEMVFPIPMSVDLTNVVNLEWTEALGATGYLLSVGTLSGQYDILDQMDVGFVNNYLLEDLPCGDTIHIFIQPYNTFGIQSSCAEIWFVTHPNFNEFEQAEICTGDTYLWQGDHYSDPGVYTMEYIDSYGCDSSYTLSLSVSPVFFEYSAVSICSDDSYFWQGEYFNESGIYTKNYQTVDGCDSLFELELHVYPTYYTMLSDTICQGESILWEGLTLTLPGIYTSHYYSVYDCDSIIEIELSVLDTFSYTDNISICPGEEFEWHGMFYTQPGSYHMAYVSTYGCDSNYTLELSYLPDYSFSEEQIICDGDTLLWQGMELFEGGHFEAEYVSMDGCDSSYLLDLVMVIPDVSIQEGEDYLYVNDDVLSSYQWISCPDLEHIEGATSSTFEIDSSGTYAVIVEKLGCVDTSFCHPIIHSGLLGIQSDPEIHIYPNPSVKDQLHIEVNDEFGEVRFELLDLNGNRLLTSKTIEGRGTINCQTIPSGLYMIRFHTNSGIHCKKLIISN